MANRYWVGGTASWDGTAGTKWSATSGGAGGASVPTSADDVFFDNLSTGTVTIATGNTGAKSITCTGFTGTLTGTAAITVSGSITLVAGMTYSHTGTVTINATATLTTAGKAFSGLTINGSGITVSLGDALNISTRALRLTLGTFTTTASNYSITAGSYTQTGGALTLNASSVTVSDGGNAWSVSGGTVSAGTSTITMTATNPYFYSTGNYTWRNLTFSSGAISIAYVYGSNNTFTNITIASQSANGVARIGWGAGNTQTVSTLVASGGSAIRRLFFFSTTEGTAANIAVTTWSTISDIDFQDISLNSSRSGTRLGNRGGNTNITFPAAKTVYWNLTGTQSWSATAWATTSGGTPAANNFPLAQDTAIFDNAGAATTVTCSGSYAVGNVDFSGRTSAITASISDLYVIGNWTNGSGVTLSGTGTLFFTGRTPQTITSAGKTWSSTFYIGCAGSTVTLADALTSTGTGNGVNLVSGTFNSAGYNVTFTASAFSSQSPQIARTLAFGSGSNWSIGTSGVSAWAVNSTNFTFTGTGNLAFTSLSAKTFAGGGATYSGLTVDQNGAGTLTISGSNTLANIVSNYCLSSATTLTLTAGTTQTLTYFTASGTSGRVLTLNTTGAAATLSVASGRIGVSYISMSNITATGGATFIAYNSTNGGGNTGWTFSAGAARYWVGGTASWDGSPGTKWADSPTLTTGNASIPSTSNDVYFGIYSSGTVTIAGGNTGAKSISCTGFTGTIAGTSAITIAGDITLVSGMSYTHSGTVTVTGTGTITTAGKTFSPLTINGSGITVSLGDALNMSTRTLTVTQGTFTTTASNYSITASGISSNNSNTRTIALNSSTVTLSSTGTPLSMTSVTNLTFTGSACTINLSGAAPGISVGTGVTVPGTVAFTSTSVDSNYKTGAAINFGTTFTNLTFNAPTSAGIVSCSLAADITVTGTLTCASSNPWQRTFLYSTVQGTARTITATAVSLTDADFQDITGAGAASWTGTRLGNAQGNSAITFPVAKTVYWGITGSGDYGSTNWATSIGGATASANFPLPQDTAVFPSTYPSSGQTITQDLFNYGAVDSSARTSNTLQFSPSGPDTYAVFGNLIYGTGVTQQSTMRWLFANRTSQSFTPTSGSMGAAFTVNSVSGTVTMNGDLTYSGSSFELLSGTFNLNGYNVTGSGGFTTSGSLTRTLNFGSGSAVWNSSAGSWSTSGSNITFSGTGTIRMSASGAKTFTGGSVAYTNITLDQASASTLTIAGSNTFADITNSYGPTGATTVTFTAGTTQTVSDFTAAGTSGKLLTLNSTVAGSQATLSKSSGTVSVDYLSIRDSNATGGAAWYAANSTNVSNNTGWIFSAPAGPATANFLMFFI